MRDLRKRFGELVAAHRRRRKLTQEQLAEAADLSVDMISKIETGVTGARFPVIERIAGVLAVDPAELFTTAIPSGTMSRGAFGTISARLAQLTEPELAWISNLIEAALASPDSVAKSPPNQVAGLKHVRSARSSHGRSSR